LVKKNIIILIIFLSIYLINRFLKPYIDISIIEYIQKCHLNDFLGGAVFCIYTNMILIFNKKKPITNFYQLMVFMLFVALIWEYFFPLILPYSTSDIFDVVSYLLGTITYYFLNYKSIFVKYD